MIYLTSRLYTTWIPKKLRRSDLEPWMAAPTRNTLVSAAARRIRKQKRRYITTPNARFSSWLLSGAAATGRAYEGKGRIKSLSDHLGGGSASPEAVLNQELGRGSRKLSGRGCQQASSVPGLTQGSSRGGVVPVPLPAPPSAILFLALALPHRLKVDGGRRGNLVSVPAWAGDVIVTAKGVSRARTTSR